MPQGDAITIAIAGQVALNGTGTSWDFAADPILNGLGLVASQAGLTGVSGL